MDAKPPVKPLLHPIANVKRAIKKGEIWSNEVRETMAYFGINNQWATFYLISEAVNLEASMLIDADDFCYVDWGSVSKVGLNPPEGATIPFQVWTHPHPRGDAYWSMTDKNSLAIASAVGLISKAIVLGRGEMKIANWIKQGADEPIQTTGPLSHWTEEKIVKNIITNKNWLNGVEE